MPGDIGLVETVASLSLIVVVIAISRWQKLDVERSITWASMRAAAQLVAVGLIFGLIFTAAQAITWAWVWVVAMTLISAEVVTRRTQHMPGIRLSALASMGGALLVTLGLLFGLGVFDLEPVTLVVIAGITLGNTLPSAVLAADTITDEFVDHPERVEGLLALGFDRRGASRQLAHTSLRTALLPQIERTKVMGLIALPGAMTGMLLAGADPIPAVLVQIVIAYLVLGSVGIAATVTVIVIASRAFTSDLRLAPWVREPT